MSDAEVIKKRQRDSLFPTAGRGAGTAEGAKGRDAEKQGGAASPKVPMELRPDLRYDLGADGGCGAVCDGFVNSVVRGRVFGPLGSVLGMRFLEIGIVFLPSLICSNWKIDWVIYSFHVMSGFNVFIFVC